MSQFLNPFMQDPQVQIIGAIGAILFLGLFGIIYDRWMTDLGEIKEGYIALLVALGVFVTLIVVAVFSWQAAVLTLLAFLVDGIAMIAGDIKRSIKRRGQVVKTKRRKPLPYAAAYIVDQARMDLKEANKYITEAIQKDDRGQTALAALKIASAYEKLSNALTTEGE